MLLLIINMYSICIGADVVKHDIKQLPFNLIVLLLT